MSKINNFKNVYLSVFLLFMFFLISCDTNENIVEGENNSHSVKIGLLSAQTGGASHFGLPAYYAYLKSESDLIEYYGNNFSINSVIEDTESDKEVCLQKLIAFKEQNINLVIGPFTSSELAYVRDYAKTNNMVLISPSSVSRSIALTDDYIFRMASDDSYQTEAILKLLDEEGIKNIILIWRDDVWGNDLAGLVKTNFTNSGGAVFDSLKYDPSTGDFSSIVEQLSAKTDQMLNTFNPEKSAIYLLSFNEAANILEKSALMNSQLESINWYGSSAVSQSTPFLSNNSAAEFATQVGFLCPIHGLDDNAKDKYSAINNYIVAQSGLSGNIYSFNTYDALWIAVLNSFRSDISQPEEFTSSLRETAGNYFGATGRVIFNDAGDRIPQTFDFFGIDKNNRQYEWNRKAVFDFRSDKLLWE